MRSKVILLTFPFLLTCGTNKPKENTSIEIKEVLKQKYELYKELNNSVQDTNGFILFEHCDSLLFSSLLGISKQVNVEAAKNSNGQWFRRPLTYPECYSNYSSKSTISRDMLLGLFYYIYYNKRLDIAEDLFKYGQDNLWIMGEGDPSRTVFTPSMQATLAEIIYKLGGDNHPHRLYPQSFTKNTSFEAHLTILHILLRAELLGKLTNEELDIVKYQYKRLPKNALFSYTYHKYTDGNQEETINTLLDTNIFPNSNLPTSNNYCTDWLWSRDESKDWSPCPEENKQWTGGELIFVAHLILN